jgi:hypothetical protein
MKFGARMVLTAAVVCVVGLLVALFVSAPKHPVALIRVIDSSGNPVADAVIRPNGLRTKPGPYASGWYAWTTAWGRPTQNPVPPKTAWTDSDGYARVPYPKYVFERIETGKIIISVDHPKFVPSRPECIVAVAPPAGAPWKVWMNYILDSIQHKTLIVRPDPVTLQQGAGLKISESPDAPGPKGSLLFAQVSEVWDQGDFWTRPKDGALLTKRLAAGPHSVRAIRFAPNGAAWFSDVTNITAALGETNELVMELKPGVTVHGRLDSEVPRPVRDGRVVMHVWPKGLEPSGNPPQWHGWSSIRPDGSFEITSLPEGDLEVVALCAGFISTNGPGRQGTRAPQKYVLGTNDLSITVGMKPTARLEVQVQDADGKPLAGAKVQTWPNVTYGQWSSTIFAGDLYKTSDEFLRNTNLPLLFSVTVRDFEATSDSSGLALLPNLPPEVGEFAVEHPQYVLPAMEMPFGGKRREARVVLTAGITNRVSVRLERKGERQISHY